jgi:hypothetical protein
VHGFMDSQKIAGAGLEVIDRTLNLLAAADK